jgi:hypothetical protein
MTKRTAQCGCGRLQVSVEGDPFLVSTCHCDFCQKRTGSAFGVEAFFPDDERITVSGETKRYNGLETDGVGSVTGFDPTYYFCPTCGSTVYWTFTELTIIGIAVGNFVDPNFPTPTMETSTRLRHHWMPALSSAEQFEDFPIESETSNPSQPTQ